MVIEERGNDERGEMMRWVRVREMSSDDDDDDDE